MTKRNRFPLIGVTLATPALMTVGVSQASVSRISAPNSAVIVPVSNIAAQARLKAELLTLGRDEKLQIAGDRVKLAVDEHEVQVAYNTMAPCNTSSHRVGAEGVRPPKAAIVRPTASTYTTACRKHLHTNTPPK